jgi:hypothetical protein
MVRLPHPAHQATAAAVLALAAGAAGCAGPEPSVGAALLEPVYCYRTLADVTCRTGPDPGRGGRLVGVYLRDPDDPSWLDWWLRRAGAWP